jgi:Zinc finger, C3HC4 type (RING finger)
MLQVNVKINPQSSKRKIGEDSIASGQKYYDTVEDLYQFAKELGDASIQQMQDNSFMLTVRSFKTEPSAITNEFIRQFELLEENPKRDQEVLFCRKGHEDIFLFRGTLKKFDKSIFETRECEKILSKCRICMETDSSCTFYPCGHVCICSDCKQDYERRFGTCPVCKIKYTVCFKIFL